MRRPFVHDSEFPGSLDELYDEVKAQSLVRGFRSSILRRKERPSLIKIEFSCSARKKFRCLWRLIAEAPTKAGPFTIKLDRSHAHVTNTRSDSVELYSKFSIRQGGAASESDQSVQGKFRVPKRKSNSQTQPKVQDQSSDSSEEADVEMQEDCEYADSNNGDTDRATRSRQSSKTSAVSFYNSAAGRQRAQELVKEVEEGRKVINELQVGAKVYGDATALIEEVRLVSAFVGHKVWLVKHDTHVTSDKQSRIRLSCDRTRTAGCPWSVCAEAASRDGPVYTIQTLTNKHNHPLSPHPRREELVVRTPPQSEEGPSPKRRRSPTDTERTQAFDRPAKSRSGNQDFAPQNPIVPSDANPTKFVSSIDALSSSLSFKKKRLSSSGSPFGSTESTFTAPESPLRSPARLDTELREASPPLVSASPLPRMLAASPPRMPPRLVSPAQSEPERPLPRVRIHDRDYRLDQFISRHGEVLWSQVEECLGALKATDGKLGGA